ncbi:PLD nuclease N-terminal domain-containing protein [Cognatishimia sp. SS12]|uniref:PLD nuclease N-terminal domain-containing protein n=1 Tax=Cognatishimia sp. SS12 TaxID=2979465 RepID=UPI00232A7FF7|nr:PLD nuclease N-terminal domain-containing protein [Cognatishimia sp. SS12]MDC0737863.1 PLD nuclease N-terminal domain-containing protein [Cognatishimia sp. SS12]
MDVAGIGGFFVLVLNVWAIVSIVGSTASTTRKVIWTILVLLLPVIGFVIWLVIGPRPAKSKA